jgi:OOP family OmpA-OmpF porin
MACKSGPIKVAVAAWLLGVVLAAGATEGPVVVSGVVPDEATRQAILGKVRAVYGARVVDQLGVAETTVPPNWSENVQKLITPELKKISKGQLRIAGNRVELLGEVESADTATQIEQSVKAKLNPTYTVQNGLLAGSAPQARIDQVLQGKIVEFEVGSAVLTPAGKVVLDELVPVLRALQGQRVQVIGHTDASGARAANVALSRARAESVRRYLVEQQVPAALITASGLGPDQPLVANDTPENRARNRRIEVRVTS